MATFYLLPPRPQIGRLFGEYLESVFPGLRWHPSAWNDLAEALGAAAQCHPRVYVVYREDLPDGSDAARALRESFGAAPGDEVVELLFRSAPEPLQARRWRIAA